MSPPPNNLKIQNKQITKTCPYATTTTRQEKYLVGNSVCEAVFLKSFGKFLLKHEASALSSVANLATKEGQDFHNSVPGCMERKINTFKLCPQIVDTNLLKEETQLDGCYASPVQGGSAEVVKEVLDPFGGQTQYPEIPLEVRHNIQVTRGSNNSFLDKKSSAKSVKMLIEQEMSKKREGRKSPGIIARLMGLEALPAQQLVPVPSRVIVESCRKHAIDEATQGPQLQQTVYQEIMNPQTIQPLHSRVNENRECKDVYEVWKQPSRISHLNDEHPSFGRFHDKSDEKRMSLVHQNFLVAKHLAKNENLLQSQEFQDALGVLSSNKDIFLKFLKEPNWQFSNHLHRKEVASLPNKTKCITVLKPSRILDLTNEKKLKEEDMLAEVNGFSKSGSLSHPTRIVVLKPNPRKPDLKEIISSPINQRLLNGDNSFEDLRNDEAKESREVAREVTRKMRESLSSNRRDEMLLSSSLLNECMGDASSFGSECIYMEEGFANSSDSQAVTPTSQHSWDYINKLGSSYSLSLYSKASYSPESSVIREAKKRLSERLAMVSSNEVNQEQKLVRRSSSTLGEMLALSETTTENGRDEDFIPNTTLGAKDYDQKEASSCLSSSSNSKTLDQKLNMVSHVGLQRSKSVPSSASEYENVDKHLEVLGSGASKSAQEITKSKSQKVSIRGKVSGLFSRNMKSSNEKSLSGPLGKAPSSSTMLKNNILFACASSYLVEEGPTCIDEEMPSKETCSTSDIDGSREGNQFSKETLSLGKPSFSGISSENMEQPSPVSVLEPTFEEDASSCSSQSHDGAGLEFRAISSSPLIESVARSLSWDDVTSADGSNFNLKSQETGLGIEERERLDFVKSILSSSGLDNETTSSALNKWHTLESPLNPLLLEQFLERKEEDAKCRQRRSKQRLLFDCVNSALVEISQIDLVDACCQSKPSLRTYNEAPVNNMVEDEVIGRVTGWFSVDDHLQSDCGNSNSLIVDEVIRKEIGGRAWEEMTYLEIMEMEREIERHVIHEVVAEVFDVFISR